METVPARPKALPLAEASYCVTTWRFVRRSVLRSAEHRPNFWKRLGRVRSAPFRERLGRPGRALNPSPTSLKIGGGRAMRNRLLVRLRPDLPSTKTSHLPSFALLKTTHP